MKTIFELGKPRADVLGGGIKESDLRARAAPQAGVLGQGEKAAAAGDVDGGANVTHPCARRPG